MGKGASVRHEDSADELNSSELEDFSENMNFVSVSKLKHGDSFEERIEFMTTKDSLPPDMEKIRALEKKLLAERREEKVPRRKLLVK
ncbi:hypothetical protein TorRG33x02_268490, partial [Trema orientale]